MSDYNAKEKCNPGNYDAKNNTCFTSKQLIEMTGAYNRHITKKNIGGDEKGEKAYNYIKIKSDVKYLLKELLKRFEDICGNDEYCLTKQEFMNEVVKEMRDEIKNETFRTKGPEDSTDWLSNSDIEAMMKPYEKIFKEYEFLGAIPLNCDEISKCVLYNFNFNKALKNGKTKFGAIFNHDRYGQPGSHWVSLYMDYDKGIANFYDSAGAPPIENIHNLINQFKEFCKKHNKKCEYRENKKRYQLDKSECGVYSCNAQVRELNNESFDDIVKNSLDFKQINSCRNIYFVNGSSKYKVDPLCDPGRERHLY